MDWSFSCVQVSVNLSDWVAYMGESLTPSESNDAENNYVLFETTINSENETLPSCHHVKVRNKQNKTICYYYCQLIAPTHGLKGRSKIS